MDQIGKVYYERGLRYFELEKYEEAVSDWVQAYDLGYEKENILEIIYNCFVKPNEQEFRKNYERSKVGITELPFDACSIDFIPLCENRFWIFDRDERKFHGTITLEEEPIQGRQVEFNNIMYTDTWDIREMIPDLKEHIRDVVYVLLNNLESKFVSFLKLPHFKELYLKNVVVLKNEAVMYELFERFEEFYLPKDIVTVDVEKYYRLINKLHEHRICCMNKERQNVFLSICIPSYNRGKIVLENVEHLLSCSYDSEIEIIVSNNGSTYEIEEYDTIKNMTDSRVRYHEFKENQGFAANILKICSMANGKYAVIASDEDFMKLESFGDFLNFIKRNAECGIFVSSTNGEAANKHISEGIMGSGLGTIATISTWSYMTGYTYNMEYCRKLKAVELVDSFRCGWPVDWNDEEIMLNRELHINLFLEIFTHVCLAMILCKYVDSAWTRLNIWDTEKHNTKPERKLTLGARPESRIEKQNSCLDFCYQVLRLSKQDFVNMFQYKCKRTHFLIKLSFHAFPDDMSKIGEEQMIHDWIYKEQMRYLDSFPFDLTEEEHSVIQKQILSWE